MSINFSERYLASMQCHSMGNALYEPPVSSELRPGMCGYLDGLGKWQPVLDLLDSTALSMASLATLDSTFKRMPLQEIDTGGPFRGDTTRRKKHEVSIEPPLAAAGIPATCSVWWDFDSQTDFGAVLACPFKLLKEGFYEDRNWVTWAKENASAIIKAKPGVKKHGLWLVTTVYTTKEAWINVWGDKNNVVSIGFSAGVEGVAEVAPSVEFTKSTSGSNWRKLPAKGALSEDVVVFFHGVKMQYWKVVGGLHEVRGDGETVVQDPEDENVLYQVQIETVGF